MVVVALMSFIVLALMAVFNSTQRAFRSSVTQSDVLEGSRATMEMIASDLRGITPSDNYYAVNFLITSNANYSLPLVQTLPPGGIYRSNLLQQVFILNHQNNIWWGVAYAISYNSSGALYSLYRLQYPTPPLGTTDPTTLFTNQVFQNFFYNPTNGGSHLLDGVVHFVVRPYNPSGYWMTNNYYVNSAGQTATNLNVSFYLPYFSETGSYFFSNAVPASVELEMGVLEDAALARAESLPVTPVDRRTPYLQSSAIAGVVHLFRQRVSIANVDPTAYP